MASRIGGQLWKSGAVAPTFLAGKTYTPAASYPSSSSNKNYTVCEVSDGTVSCDCMGWTRRNPPGGRTCKHTKDYVQYLQGTPPTTVRVAPVPAAPKERYQRQPPDEKGGSLSDLFAKLDKGEV